MDKKFYDRADSCYFVNDLDEVAVFCKENCAEETAHILRIANEVCKNEFLFDLKWDMERTYEPVIFENDIDWFYMPGDDPEFIFQFNRHRFFICLGQAYALTKDEKYAKKYTELLMDWIDKSKLCEANQNTTWRTIEAGLRAEYWTRAFRYFKDSRYITEEVTNSFIKSMKEHAQYIIEQHSVLRRMSNWSILEDHGLFEIGCFLPQDEDTRRYIDIALDRLAMEVRLQVLPDGTQWEQSPMYHNEVLHCLFDVIIYAKKNQALVGSQKNKEAVALIEASVRKLVYADLKWKKPDNHQFINGDSDDTDISDMFNVGAYHFDDSILKSASRCKTLDFDNAWDLGLEGIRHFEHISSDEPDFCSGTLENSGNYYLRSDWSENANLLHFHCGTIGAGHGHSDQLHVDLVVHGEDVLTDSGRYNYVAGADRYEFKNPAAHNTITVDNEMFTIPHDSWRCSKLSQPVNQKHLFLPDYEFVQGGHLGYMETRGVFVNRKIIHIKPDIYVICDEMYTNGKHNYQQYFNLNDAGIVELTCGRGGALGQSAVGAGSIDNLHIDAKHTEAVYFDKDNNPETYKLKREDESIEYRAEIKHDEINACKAIYRGSKADTEMYFMAPGLAAELIDTRISRNYNEAKPRKTIKLEFGGTGFCSAFTVIYAKEKSDAAQDITINKVQVDSVFNREIHPDYYAEALRIRVGENRDYVLIVCHQEVNSPTDQTGAAGCMGFGNVLVFDCNKERQPGTVLLY